MVAETPRNRGRRRIHPVRRPWLIFLVATAVAAAAVVVPVGLYVHRTNHAIRAWESARREAVVVGMTPDAVTAAFGPPTLVDRTENTGSIVSVMYAGPYWNYCRIDFTDGKASRITFWGK
jgi:hypothetical protein